MNNEGWAPPSNTNLFFEPDSCMGGLRSFQQYSGQCWSDASSIFMLYSFTLSAMFQRAFQTLSKTDLETGFIEWCHTAGKQFLYELLVKEDPSKRAELKPLIDSYYISLVNALSQYLVCLQRRYLNSITAPSREETISVIKKRTCSPKVYSFCKEESGRYVTLYMNPIALEKRGELQIYTTLAPYNLAAAKAKRINILKRPNLKNTNIVSFLPEGSQGGVPAVFSKCIPLYCKFFEYSFDAPSLLFATSVLNNSEKLEKSIAPFASRPILFADTLSNLTKDRDAGIYINQFMSIQKLLELNYKVSLVLTTKRYDEAKGHAITLLECDNAQTILYDNEMGTMLELPWPQLFKKVPNTDQTPTILYSTGLETIGDSASLFEILNTRLGALIPVSLFSFYIGLLLQTPLFICIYTEIQMIKIIKKDGTIRAFRFPDLQFEFHMYQICNSIGGFCQKVEAFDMCLFEKRREGGFRKALRRGSRLTRRRGLRRRLTRRQRGLK